MLNISALCVVRLTCCCCLLDGGGWLVLSRLHSSGFPANARIIRYIVVLVLLRACQAQTRNYCGCVVKISITGLRRARSQTKRRDVSLNRRKFTSRLHFLRVSHKFRNLSDGRMRSRACVCVCVCYSKLIMRRIS